MSIFQRSANKHGRKSVAYSSQWVSFTSLFSPVKTIRTFSLKGMTSKLFGQETPEQREAKLKMLETQIEEGEELVKDSNAECE